MEKKEQGKGPGSKAVAGTMGEEKRAKIEKELAELEKIVMGRNAAKRAGGKIATPAEAKKTKGPRTSPFTHQELAEIEREVQAKLKAGHESPAEKKRKELAEMGLDDFMKDSRLRLDMSLAQLENDGWWEVYYQFGLNALMDSIAPEKENLLEYPAAQELIRNHSITLLALLEPYLGEGSERLDISDLPGFIMGFYHAMLSCMVLGYELGFPIGYTEGEDDFKGKEEPAVGEGSGK